MGLIDVLEQFGFDRENKARMVRHQDRRPGVDFDALFRSGSFEEYQSWQDRHIFGDSDFLVSFIGDGAGRARLWHVYCVLGYKVVPFDELPQGVPWPWRYERPHYRYELQAIPDYDPLVDRLVIEWGGELAWVQHLRNNRILECPPLHDIDLPTWTPLFAEGKAFSRLIISRQRSREAREKCLEIHGYQCAVCEMTFPERYGGLGAGFMHVHHVSSLAARSGEYEIDPEKDLMPVCPNCHAMLHWDTDTPRSVAELRRIIRK